MDTSPSEHPVIDTKEESWDKLMVSVQVAYQGLLLSARFILDGLLGKFWRSRFKAIEIT